MGRRQVVELGLGVVEMSRAEFVGRSPRFFLPLPATRVGVPACLGGQYLCTVLLPLCFVDGEEEIETLES